MQDNAMKDLEEGVCALAEHLHISPSTAWRRLYLLAQKSALIYISLGGNQAK